MGKKSNRFFPEVRERAVRMAQEHRGEYPRDWQATTIEQFIQVVDFYIRWYNANEKRIKIALGSLSPIEYRESLRSYGISSPSFCPHPPACSRPDIGTSNLTVSNVATISMTAVPATAALLKYIPLHCRLSI